jgi:hypothetical protein
LYLGFKSFRPLIHIRATLTVAYEIGLYLHSEAGVPDILVSRDSP